jgi:hypothetical protein
MNITTAYNQRLFLIPQADFVSSSQENLIKTIMKKHGQDLITNIKLIDENDEYDSFLIEVYNKGFCLKMSFDSVPIFYEYMILKGLEHLKISPQAIDRSEIEYGKKIYYTIQSFEYSENLQQIGGSNLLDKNFSNIFKTLNKMHLYCPPEEVWPHLDNTKSFLDYQNINFDNLISYVEKPEEEIFSFIKKIYQEVWSEMVEIYETKKSKLTLNKFVHGNLNLSSIISNSFEFKFINFENSFMGSPFFDLFNLVLEAQMSGIHEYDFVTKRIKEMNIVENRLKSAKFLEEYKVCKEIWMRKKFLDLIRGYIKEIIILNKTRVGKMAKLGHIFSNQFYRFDEIKSFYENKSILIDKFNEIILDF